MSTFSFCSNLELPLVGSSPSVGTIANSFYGFIDKSAKLSITHICDSVTSIAHFFFPIRHILSSCHDNIQR